MSQNLRTTFSGRACLEEKGDSYEPDRQIISLLSHELRTPLSIISSNIQLLKEFEYKLNSKVVNETFLLCEEAIGSMTSFMEDIYFLNVSNKGELKKTPSLMNLKEFFRIFLNDLSNTDFINADRVHFEENFLTETFCTDTTLLKRILKSLISNALRFSSEIVILNVTCSEKELEIQIEDQGIGIPEDEIDDVFHPFYRGKNARLISGCGLGLAIVQRSMDLLNGKIEVISMINQGTKFKIKIINDECKKNIDYRG